MKDGRAGCLLFFYSFYYVRMSLFAFVLLALPHSDIGWYMICDRGIIGITHVFHALIFARSRGSCLTMRPTLRKHLLRDPASVNAMKQTCVVVILANYT